MHVSSDDKPLLTSSKEVKSSQRKAFETAYHISSTRERDGDLNLFPYSLIKQPVWKKRETKASITGWSSLSVYNSSALPATVVDVKTNENRESAAEIDEFVDATVPPTSTTLNERTNQQHKSSQVKHLDVKNMHADHDKYAHIDGVENDHTMDEDDDNDDDDDDDHNSEDSDV